jgi:PAS domain S-box-containing protein
VWVLVLDREGALLHLGTSGLGDSEEQLRERISKGLYPPCVQKAMAQKGVLVFEGGLECEECPLHQIDAKVLVTALRAEGILYGVIAVRLPPGLAVDPKEQDIFSEVSHDIAFTLHTLEVRSSEKSAIAAMHKSEEKYRVLVENISETIFSMDRNGIITYCSQAIIDVLGYSPREIIGKPLQKFMVPEDGEKVEKLFGGSHFKINERVELRVFDKLKKIHIIAVMLNPLYEGEEITGLTGILFDITEQRENQEKIAVALDQITRNLEQMAILNDSIRNPLSLIVGLAGMEGGEKNEKILKASWEINAIITQLDLGWIESEKVHRFLRAHYDIFLEKQEEEK